MNSTKKSEITSKEVENLMRLISSGEYKLAYELYKPFGGINLYGDVKNHFSVTIKDIVAETDINNLYRVLKSARDDHFGVFINQLKKVGLYKKFKSLDMFGSCNGFILEYKHLSVKIRFNGDFLGVISHYFILKNMEDVKQMSSDMESAIKLKDDERFLSIFVSDEFIDSYYYLVFIEDVSSLYSKKRIL